MSDPDLSSPGASPQRALERDAQHEGWAASDLHIAQNGRAPAPRRPAREVSLVFVEINEAERHFLDKFIEAGKLPTLARMRTEGAFLTTSIPGWSSESERSWRAIMPWIIWPSVYTGLPPSE